MAVQFEKLENKTFDEEFFDRMEGINYARLIQGKDYKVPEFLEGVDPDQGLK